MTQTRRNVLKSAALAAGLIAARSLHRRVRAAPAACSDPSKAQFIILNTSAAGDPINTNAPGTYGITGILHNPAGSMVPTNLTVGGQATIAAKAWSLLPQSVLDRLGVWHLMTNTVVHPKEGAVLQLMSSGEMLPSLLARQLAPCLGTIQSEPISLGAATPIEGLTYRGQPLSNLSPLAFKQALTTTTGPLAALHPLRDETVARLDALYREGATLSQAAYLDRLGVARQNVRALQGDDTLAASIADNGIASQIATAIALIKLRVTPVITVHIPFGGDNHNDPALAQETAGTLAGMNSIAALIAALETAGLQDQVTFVSLNVFGRTMGPSTGNGRQHNPYHQVSLTIGKPFKAGIYGGVGPAPGDFGATALGDIPAIETLASFGKTMLAAIGTGSSTIDASITSGTVVSDALA